ncbi:MAG: 30S ribosomal protein S6 [Myxococcota bacterium]
MSHEYEIAVVVRPDIDDGLIKATFEKIEEVITGQGGHILDREEWRKHKLAYAINDHTSGYFAFIYCVADPSHILEVERRMRLNESVLRFLTIKRAETVDVATRLEEAAEVRKAREAEAARRLAEQEAIAAEEARRAEMAAEAARLREEAAAAAAPAEEAPADDTAEAPAE